MVDVVGDRISSLIRISEGIISMLQAGLASLRQISSVGIIEAMDGNY